jgi:hypothetical protein
MLLELSSMFPSDFAGKRSSGFSEGGESIRRDRDNPILSASLRNEIIIAKKGV